MYWQESLTHLMNVKMPDRAFLKSGIQNLKLDWLQMSHLVGKPTM